MRKATFPLVAIAAAVLAGCVSSDPPGAGSAADQPATGQAVLSAAETCADAAGDPQVRIDGCTVLIETQDDPALVATAFNNRGGAYTELERYRDAWRDFDEALARDPDLAPAYVNRGYAFYRLDQNRRSIADFDQAIALDPTTVSAYFHRGLAHSDLEEYQVAVADFDRAIALDPDHAGAYLRRAMARHDLGQYRAAIGDFDRAIELNPTYPENYQFRGYARCRLGQGTLAYDDWMQADRVGDADRRRLYQRIAIDQDHYDGPVDGEATPAWHNAIAYRARVTC